MYKSYQNILNKLKSDFHFRTLQNIENKDNKYIFCNGKRLLNLSSNNYLGFADNIELWQEFLVSNKNISSGSASSRLLTGNLPVYNGLEKLLSSLYKKEACLLFNSGYHANVGVMSALVSKKDVVFSDKLNHASIIDGMKLSDGKFFRYKHNAMEHLEKLLVKERNNFENAIIVTESLFSMDGDICDLKALVALKKKYNAILVVDEAHSFGVFGENALGIAEEQGILNEIDLIIATFGKSIGSMGAFALGSRVLIDFLINKSRSFIFSTALPPVNVAFSQWVIENKLAKTHLSRQQMLNVAEKLRGKLIENNIKTCGNSQIIPVIIGDNETVVKLSENLYEHGYFVLPIRPPTVPLNSSRLRISLNTEISWDEIENLPSLIKGGLS